MSFYVDQINNIKLLQMALMKIGQKISYYKNIIRIIKYLKYYNKILIKDINNFNFYLLLFFKDFY